MTALRWTAGGEAAGERVDRHVAAHLGEPRNQVERWIRDGRVTVAGRPVRASRRLAGGEEIACEPPPPLACDRVEPEPAELAIVYEDADLVVVDKPAGLVVHPGAGRATGTLVHRLLARYPEMAHVGGPGRPGIVHRLDKDTTGLLVAARNPLAHRRLAAAFAAREVDKRYLGIVWGTPRTASMRLDAPIGRHPARRTQMAVRARGRPATTQVQLLQSAAGISLLAIRIATGRTHQIRVHLQAAGVPLVGDPVYGAARGPAALPPARDLLRRFPRPALHAWRLVLLHPATGQPLRCEAPVPGDLAQLWQGATGGELAACLAAGQS